MFLLTAPAQVNQHDHDDPISAPNHCTQRTSVIED